MYGPANGTVLSQAKMALLLIVGDVVAAVNVVSFVAVMTIPRLTAIALSEVFYRACDSNCVFSIRSHREEGLEKAILPSELQH
jgi:hypothetical protein